MVAEADRVAERRLHLDLRGERHSGIDLKAVIVDWETWLYHTVGMYCALVVRASRQKGL